MTRRKSVCTKWTLVLLVVILCPFVYSRPQDTSSLSSTASSVQTDNTTENPIRYRYRQSNFKLDEIRLPVPIGFANTSYKGLEPKKHYDFDNSSSTKFTTDTLLDKNKTFLNRTHRMISKTVINGNRNNKKPNKRLNQPNIKDDLISTSRKPTIRKVVTKWTDNAKYEDLNISFETSISTEKDSVAFTNSLSLDDYSSTENILDQSAAAQKRPFYPNKFYNKLEKNKIYQPEFESDEENVGVIHSNKVHIIEYPFPSVRPAYVYTTPKPTPIITNLGTPKPWSPHKNVNRKPTQQPVRKKPLKGQYNYHNNVHNYPQYGGDNFEVTTFQPSNAYTERIVIRPEEYSASNDCPTVFLTLNNTFQGQGKEACPDLNIAVNTNVVNKNVVVESDEEDPENLIPGGFGLPFGDDSEAEDAAASNDYFESDENAGQEQEEAESASVEATGLSNYNAAIHSDSGAPSHGGFPSGALSGGKPGKPHDEDELSLSGMMSFFKPAINALTWLAAINPFSFTIISMMLTPLVMLLAGFSGVSALFAPLGLAREASPKIVHVYRPKWEWDDKYKTWYLNSFPDNRRFRPPRLPRNSKEDDSDTRSESVKPTLFFKVKKWMIDVTNKLKETTKKENLKKENISQKPRKKRETWPNRVINPGNSNSTKQEEVKKSEEPTTSPPATPNAPRNNKNKSPVIGESIKMVANQLLENPSSTTEETPVVTDTRIPPKLKNQIIQKHKIKTRNEDGVEPLDNSHPGVAVPVTMEELESENKVSESSTSNEGISTWVLLSNTYNKDNSTSTESTKIEEPQKKSKPNKNKTKRPSTNKVSLGKRPIIGSTNKSDLVAGGSAINENVFNKIKDTVLSNVQKNKNQSSQKTTTVSTTTVTTTTMSPSTESSTTKKETTQSTKVSTSVAPAVKVTSKPTKKKNKNKNKTTSTTHSPVDKESALLPMEPKEQEIELEISTPATTTKKPKRTSTRKKNKTKKRKTTKPKPEATTITAVKTTNKTKTKKDKKPDLTSITGPITSSIYSYFSREVMPTVGVGVLGLASLVGLAGYFLYPFATPVRRTFEVDKKDDIYRHNAEEYANEGNGQAEEEMLGTVLAGMPAHSKHKLNPYAGQTTHINRYPVKKDQDIRYRHVAAGSAGHEPNYNVHYPQQKTGIAHGAVYSEPYNPHHHHHETRHAYTTEGKYVYSKGPSGYTPYPTPVEPIYAAPQTGPQTGPSGISGYGNDASNSVVYGVKPSSDSDFKPVYPFDSQFYSETTSSPSNYPSTSMYLGSNNDAEEQNYSENSETDNESSDNKFVVGNVPKELSETATPAVVPEHGPRNLRNGRSLRRKRSLATRIEEILKEAENKNNDLFNSNEVEEVPKNPVKALAALEDMMKSDVTSVPDIKDVFTVYAVSSDSNTEEKTTKNPTDNTEIVESVSTVPISDNKEKSTTEFTRDFDTTTKSFRVYEVFPSSSPDVSDQSTSVANASPKLETTTQFKNMNTETTTELKSETTSTMPPSPSPVFSTTFQSFTTNNPEVLTYPPLNEGGFFTFLKRLIEFKYRLGLSILQTTSENLNRYLRSMENSVQKVAKASTT